MSRGPARGSPIPANANKTPRVRSSRLRDEAYAELVRLDTHGLDSCGADCANRPPLGRCEHHEVEARLGYAIEPERPSDLAIAHALQSLADQAAYEAAMAAPVAERESRIAEALDAGLISPELHDTLLQIEWEEQEAELRAAAFAIAPVAESARRWRDDLDDGQHEARRRLQHARHNEGWTSDDVALYKTLTEPVPVRPLDELYPPALLTAAKRLLDMQKRQAKGTLARSKRVSPSDRRRIPTYITPPLHVQLGLIATATHPAELERAVRDLRRNAKRLGLHAPDLDRRRKAAGS